MAQTSDTILIRKNIRLGHHSHLIFDVERDIYRASFWRPRKPMEEKLMPPADIHHAMTQAGMIPKKPRDYWVRATAKSIHLSIAIKDVLTATGEMKYYDDLIHYIKSTEWGERLTV